MKNNDILDHVFRLAVNKLNDIYQTVRTDPDFVAMFEARDEVIGRYQNVFSINNLPTLDRADFLSFLKFENNKHWTPLYRQQGLITSDMDALRNALLYLLDESHPLKSRLDKLRPHNKKPWIKGLSKAIITPVLLIMYPEKYGVWNGTSEAGMRELKIWPPVKTTSSFSEKYLAVNEILLELANKLEIDLWTLDGLWWGVRSQENEIAETVIDGIPKIKEKSAEPSIGFGMERYLQEFLFDNWEMVDVINEWKLLEDEDEIVGMEYFTDIGRIDLIAKHKTESKWLVIELKRDQASDVTMGQVQRYMGWVQENLATDGESVNGLIIAKNMNEKLKYALKTSTNIEFMKYEVTFALSKPE